MNLSEVQRQTPLFHGEAVQGREGQCADSDILQPDFIERRHFVALVMSERETESREAAGEADGGLDED